MKRLWVVPVMLLCAFALYASTSFSVNPSEMKSGETKKLVDGDRTVTITRNGEALDIRIEGGASSDTLTITRGRDGIRIERGGSGRSLVVPPMIHGESFNVPNIRHFRFNPGRTQTWFVCPKDHTTMRVPEGNADSTFKCPVDGTVMEKRKGSGFAFFFDDDEGESL
jgi:hypothetical protein